MEKAKYLTCALCHNFNSNLSQCTVDKRDTFAANQIYADTCQKKGLFLRELTVLCSASNFYKDGDIVPSAYIENLSFLPKDPNGVPLFVLTKRGIERAIPAYDGLDLISDHLMGVKREFTYQGQRELIYEYGVELAEKVCAALGINLVVLPVEEDSKGIETYKRHALIYHKASDNYGS